MKFKLLILAFVCAVTLRAADFIAKIDKLDSFDFANAIDTPKLDRRDKLDSPKLEALNTEEFVFGVWYPGEKNPRFELSFDARESMDLLQIRLDYPEAWRLYKSGEIQDFSYFGFKLYDLECGLITEEEFLRELQDYLNKFGK